MKIVPRPGIHPFLDIIGKESGDPVPITARLQETAAIIYTGGASGTAKGVMLTHAALCAAVQQFRAWFPDLQDGGESVMGVYPIFHAAGCTLSQNLPIWAGWTSIMIPRPEPAVILDMLKKYRPSLFPGMPALYIELLSRTAFRKLDLSSIKGFFSATAPLLADTAKRLQALTGKRVHDIYGLTENTAFAACTPWNGDAGPGTVGLPLPNTDIRVVDLETGTTELPAGEAGEICIKGPQLMTGYHKNPEATAAALRDGWLYTGDIGFLDGEGHLSVVDRKQEVIVTGGCSVYPREIDEILSGHPQILEACAIGIPDASAGETIRAFVVAKPGGPLTEAAITAYCKERLADHKVPKQIVFLDALPRNTVGKILQQELRASEKKQAEG
jgi:long-chain acyl-CoA synthetase